MMQRTSEYPNTPTDPPWDSPLNPLGRPLSGPAFQLLGVGPRRKLVYANGRLSDVMTGQVLYQWAVSAELCAADPPRVSLTTTTGEQIRIEEDEEGIWLTLDEATHALDLQSLALPQFDGHPHAVLLRVLLHELLVNVVDGAPLPNLLVYDRPWYRDAAMVCMVFELTGHLDLVQDWILSLREPFDRNNAGHCEPDNLGEVLYLVSLVSDASHPVVARVLEAAEECTVDDHLSGLSDFAPHPVYQTKWMKYGLARLGLPDPYQIPSLADSYSALFWMDYRDQHQHSEPFTPRDCALYPYLAWAEAHFHGAPPPLHLAGQDAPLTWETEASEANYAALDLIDLALPATRCSAPHTWHAAEMFLSLWHHPTPAAR